MVRILSTDKIGFRVRIELSDHTVYWVTQREYNQLPYAPGDDADPAEIKKQIMLIQYPRGLKLAVSCLAKRACSKEEIRRALQRNYYDPEIVDLILYKLEKGGYLNDQDFCSRWIQYRSSAKYGANRIRQELRQKGVSEDDISTAMESIDEDEQLNAAVEIAVKKRQQAEKTADPYKTKAKIIQLLVRRGFSWSVAKKAYDLAEGH